MKRITIIVALSAITIAGSASIATSSTGGKRTDHLSYRNIHAIELQNTQGHVYVTAGKSAGVRVERPTQTLFTSATSTASVSGGTLHLSSRCHGTVCQVD